MDASYYCSIFNRQRKKSEERLTPKEKMRKSLFPFWEVDESDFKVGGAFENGDDEVSAQDATRNAFNEYESGRIEVRKQTLRISNCMLIANMVVGVLSIDRMLSFLTLTGSVIQCPRDGTYYRLLRISLLQWVRVPSFVM
jgi:hypothetical protein